MASSPVTSLAGATRARRTSTTEVGIVGRIFRRISIDAGGGHPDLETTSQEGSESAFERVSGDDDDVSLGSSHTQRAIRESTNRLASMSFSAAAGVALPPSAVSGAAGQSGILIDHRPAHPSPLTTKPSPVSPQSGPSGLSMLMERGKRAAASSDDGSGDTTPQAEPSSLNDSDSMLGSRISRLDGRAAILAEVEEVEEEDMGGSSELRQYLAREAVVSPTFVPPHETTPLLGGGSAPKKPSSWKDRTAVDIAAAKNSLSKLTPADVFKACVVEPVEALPAVILGVLLNVLDGVSYGMILFPTSVYFPDFGSLGVSMFFMSCIVSQLTFSLGGSIFKGANGSMMIEAVPFFHIIVNQIVAGVGDKAHVIVATTMVAFAFSSILTGLVFFALGAFKLGALIGYFPRHILVGCIGGVGVFLIQTGLQVSLGLPEDTFENPGLDVFKPFFASWHAFSLWTIPLGLAIFLRVITHFFHHQLIFPVYFFIIPVIFYIVVAIGGWSFDTLRASGWVFDVGSNTQPWWKFYTEFDFKAVDWEVFWSVLPTQMALVFFGILHVPLNVPALGVSLCEDNVKLDRELVAHGVSNFAAGIFGTVPNYLTYVNSVLFYRVGGGSRLSGIMLAAATAGIMFIGPSVIGYLPVMVVGALIYVLGIDLVIEAVWDTRNRVNRMEYITIWVIMIGMTVFDFVIGLLIGIILACVFFVVMSSRRRPIRAVFNGSTAKSTVRRPRPQRAFIQSVGSQTYVMKLQGFLFFGTINVVEDEIRNLLDHLAWENNPIRFLIIDFALVGGLDFSSAEAFVRTQRLLAAKDVVLILCGAEPHSPVGTALRAVDLWADQEGTRVEVFTTLNDALEWTENAYLTAFYDSQTRYKASEAEQPRTIDLPKINRMPFSLAESFQNSPRRSHLARAGDDTLPGPHYYHGTATLAPPVENTKPHKHATPINMTQPLPLLVQCLGSYSDENEAFFAQFVKYFKQVIVQAGEVIWEQGSHPDGLYLIESGSLRATYEYDNHQELLQETMVAGTVAGDLSTISDTLRNCTAIAERDCVLWKLEPSSLAQMEKEVPEAAGKFIKTILKGAVEEVDVLSAYLIAVLS
ncbi:hypothetical protein Q8F55_009041 [Vanrija albida]|uniref:STAS domain-containing protein n=1 Tax=Vanrija albida TaxID=181172 RepID=A0ABR3PSQ5_9TREE